MEASTWGLLAENGGAVLGIALSLYTVFSTVDGHLRRRRERHALLRQLREEVSYFVLLARHLAKRSEQVVAFYKIPLVAHPEPAADEDSLPSTAAEHVKWLVSRARHLTEYPLAIDVKELASMLNTRQIDRLLDVKKAQRIYLQVLATRMLDLEAFPRRPGVVAVVNHLPDGNSGRRLV
jgi:hypothetical protein